MVSLNVVLKSMTFMDVVPSAFVTVGAEQPVSTTAATTATADSARIFFVDALSFIYKISLACEKYAI
jgi:hypothetical protein